MFINSPGTCRTAFLSARPRLRAISHQQGSSSSNLLPVSPSPPNPQPEPPPTDSSSPPPPGGTVKLQSADPFAAPLIDPAFLTTEADRAVMRDAIRSSIAFFQAPVWRDYIVGPFAVSSASTDAQLDAYSAASVNSVFHPVGTASMAPRHAKNGVVDPDLRVKKVVGLRVVDPSVLVRIRACGLWWFVADGFFFLLLL